MIILGIDPGTSLIGYGIIRHEKKDYEVLDYGALTSGKNLETKDRVMTIKRQFDEIIKKFQPDIVSIEELFFFKNAKTVIKVAEMRGALLVFASLHNLKIKEFTPLQIKQSVTGYGRADKTQVQEMVRVILQLELIPKPDDAADALAAAICCANSLSNDQEII